MPPKKITVKVPTHSGLRQDKEPQKAIYHFPPRVIELAKFTEKTPLSYWFEEDHKIICIQWTDFSKDRYPAE